MLLQFTLPRGNILHTAYSVENLVTWSRYSGTLFNHIEPAWITIALTAVLLSRSERDNWVGLVFVFAVVIIFTALSRSKATMLSGFLSIFLLGLRAYPRATLAIAPAIFSTGVYVVLSVPYFYKAYAAVSSGDLEGNVSVYLRYLDYVSVASLLSEGNLLLFGNGRAQSLGDESYMGTSTLMFVYRYGLLGAFFYYSTVMYMSFKSSAKWASGAIIFLSVLVLDLISNGSEALKGAMIFFTTLGMLSRKSEGQREYV